MPRGHLQLNSRANQAINARIRDPAVQQQYAEQLHELERRIGGGLDDHDDRAYAVAIEAGFAGALGLDNWSQDNVDTLSAFRQDFAALIDSSDEDSDSTLELSDDGTDFEGDATDIEGAGKKTKKSLGKPRGTQVCRFKIPMLRKAITRMRRQKKVKRSVNHPAVGRMKAPAVINYLYDTAATLHWDWSTVITDGEKKRVGKKCKEAPGTGAIAAAPKAIVPKTRALTSWQKTVQEVFRDPLFRYNSFAERMGEAKKRHRQNKKKATERTAIKQSAQRIRALPKFKKKPKSAAHERAKMVSMGLPTQFGRGTDAKKKAAVVTSF
jgi:hypothetical protein